MYCGSATAQKNEQTGMQRKTEAVQAIKQMANVVASVCKGRNVLFLWKSFKNEIYQINPRIPWNIKMNPHSLSRPKTI